MTVQSDDVSLAKSSCSKNTKQRTTESPVGNGGHLNGHEKVAKPVKSSEWPTREAIRHNGGIDINVLDRALNNSIIQLQAKFKITCKLDWYHTKGVVTEQMRDAGKEFHKYFYYSGKVPRTTVMYREYTDPGEYGYDPFVDKTDAQIRYDEALTILTPDERDAAIDVCGLDNYAGRGRLKYLQWALCKLTVHFGYHENNR